MTRVPIVPGDCEVLVPDTASHDQWLIGRGLGIGGSEVAALVGASQWSNAFQVFREKSQGWHAPEFEGNPATEWGHRLEDAVTTKAAEELGLVARTGGGLWQHRQYPVAIVTPDRIATRRRSWRAEGVIEAKTAGDGEGWSNGSAPLAYQAQTQWQLGVLGLRVGWLACLELGPARDFHLVEIHFDQEWFFEMVNEAERFWREHVLPGKPPMLDFSHPRTAELLGQIHPEVVRESVELPEEAADWIDSYHAAKDALDAAQADFEAEKNWLKFHVGDAAAAYVRDRKVVSYPEVRTRRIDTKLLRDRYPEVAAAVEVNSTHRRMIVNKIDKVDR